MNTKTSLLSSSSYQSKSCKICLVNDSKYLCPKCHLPYCSLACYRSKDHLGCSESFYQQQIMQEMSLNSFENSLSSSKKRNPIQVILEREYKQSSSTFMSIQQEQLEKQEQEEEYYQDSIINTEEDQLLSLLIERIQKGGLNLEVLDENLLWDLLSEEEQSRWIMKNPLFLEKAIHSTQVLMDYHEPWWKSILEAELSVQKEEPSSNRHVLPLITELKNETSDSHFLIDVQENQKEKGNLDDGWNSKHGNYFSHHIPKLPSNLKQLTNAQMKRVNSNLIYHFIDILFAYAFTIRQSNNEPFELLHETCDTLLTLSFVLSNPSTQVFESTNEALIFSKKRILEDLSHFVKSSTIIADPTKTSTTAKKTVTGVTLTESQIVGQQVSLTSQQEVWLYIMKEDVLTLLESKEMLLRALSDIHELLFVFITKINEKRTKKNARNDDHHSKVLFAFKKAQFFLHHAYSLNSMTIHSLNESLNLELELIVRSLSDTTKKEQHNQRDVCKDSSSVFLNSSSNRSPLIQIEEIEE